MGKKVISLGFSILPSLLIRAQRKIGLSAIELAILVQLADYWWDRDRKPFPSKAELGERLNMHPRNVQKHIAELEKAGYVTRIPRFQPLGGQTSNGYDLSGLVKRLAKLEPEFTKEAEDRKQRRRNVEKPNYRQRSLAGKD